MTEFPPQVSEEIADMLILVSEHFSRPFEERFRDEFSVLQVYTMCKLAMDGPLTMTELADSLHVTKQQMTKIIGKLATEGHVSRHHDRNDRRVIISELSEETLDYIKARRRCFSEYVRSAFERLSDEDVAELEDAIRTINKVMHKLSPTAE